MNALHGFATHYRSGLSARPLVLVHHIRRDTTDLVAALVGAGVVVRKIIGPTYSLEPAGLAALLEMGLDAVAVEHESIGTSLVELEESGALVGTGLIDTGGYGAALRAPSRLGFILELTKRGLWNYQNTSATKVLQFATAKGKQVENRFVGRAIQRAVCVELDQRGLRGAHIGLIGYGNIGSSVALAFAEQKASVTVNDVSSSKRIIAGVSGFKVLDIVSLLKAHDVLIGCTGSDCLLGVDYKFDKETLLISGSSRDIEFQSQSGRPNVILINDGLPINLATDSLPLPIAHHLFLNIMCGICEANIDGYDGIVEIADAWQETASQYWLQSYGKALSDGTLLG